MKPKLRTVVTSLRFDEERKAFNPSFERWDEFFRGLEESLANKPEEGFPTDAASVRFVATDLWPGALPVAIYYRFDDNGVELLSIREVDSPPP